MLTVAPPALKKRKTGPAGDKAAPEPEDEDEEEPEEDDVEGDNGLPEGDEEEDDEDGEGEEDALEEKSADLPANVGNSTTVNKNVAKVVPIEDD